MTKNCPNYFDEICVPIKPNGAHFSCAFIIPKVDIVPSLWNNLNNTLKTSTSLNAFKHNIKQNYFNVLKKREC